MTNGTAYRLRFDTLGAFATTITRMKSNEAVALGALRPDRLDSVHVVTKARFNPLNGSNNMIARTRDFISYRSGQPALALIDVDTKGMPEPVKARIEELGGYWPALVHVLPELAGAGRVVRRSTSAGLYRDDTNTPLKGSDGMHVFILTRDGEDSERFLKTLHDRCWLAGLGWMRVGEAGQLLDRSLVDCTVFSPERLVFEGAPVLEPPLRQDAEARRATATEGPPLDTAIACPPLRLADQARLAELHAAEEHRLAPKKAAAREAFIARQTDRIMQRGGVTRDNARRIAERHSGGVLFPRIVLEWDDPDLSGMTVGHVLADPERFAGQTLADPIEGVAYGRDKAMVLRRSDGTVWIRSFAHGLTTYELRWDAEAAAARLAGIPDELVLPFFVGIVLDGDLDPVEHARLRAQVIKRSGVGARAIEAALKAAREQRRQQRETERRARESELRRDTRLRMPRPPKDDEWLPQMRAINDVLTALPQIGQPRRDIEGDITRRKLLALPRMHLLTSETTNERDPPT
jgi:hypothetical protein